MIQVGNTYGVRIKDSSRQMDVIATIIAIKPMGQNRHPLFLYETDRYVGFGVIPTFPIRTQTKQPIALISDFCHDKSGAINVQDLYNSLGFRKEMASSI